MTINDLGDMSMLTTDDLKKGTWLMVNVWNGSKDNMVSASIDGHAAIAAKRTQPGEGEAVPSGPEHAGPLAMARQSTNGRVAFRNAKGGDETAGHITWRGFKWQGVPGPFQSWMLSKKSNHLWRVDLPVGFHTMKVTTTDRYGRTFSEVIAFEVVDQLPNMGWQQDNES